MRYKKWYLPGILIVVAALAVVYYRYDPGRSVYFPKCPFHTFTGLDCPGCGSQRAIHALLHGNIGQAADNNLLLVMSLPFLAVHYYHKTVSGITRRPYSWRVVGHPATARIIFVIVVLFWILRNIPLTPFQYLASD
ncbi:DUF2752 domain-containing protein [Pedobacter sp. SYP-B3415]|uniref:DUF2752 domain-containing protein n=1 Tax=Pedobacter sp. SYP-B3415 TaxID=2496641 RepID=UPI00101DD51A|nr:DUF2752 domain-containing protein [Pedobacter sp. SYP-B3415]